MGKALYRKYRSKKLSEIIGQEHITTVLHNALKTGNISHAYLFTGPRGVGKTSIARILAHEVNNLPYDESSNHLDIIEIDAASNRRIDEIRELRERVHTAPAAAKYKVYIIDEVHMLTKEAFNALLKTLEEPPAHVIFILATTESHKLPETIISRTQRFAFKPIDRSKAIAHLRSIADKEKIAISDEALDLIAQHGSGSFRDSISLLDQISTSSNQIELPHVQSMLGIAPNEIIEELLGILESGSTAELAIQLQQMRDNGFSPVKIAHQLSTLIRQKLLHGQLSFDPDQTGQILRDLLNVAASHDPETSLEIVLIGAVLKRQLPAQTNQLTTPKETIIAKTKPEKSTKQPNTVKPDDKPIQNEKATIPDKIEVTTKPLDNDLWLQVLEALKKKHNTLYGIVRMASSSIDNNVITLCFKFPFHQKRISEAKNKQILIDIIQNISGNSVQINCIVDKNLDLDLLKRPTQTLKKPADTDTIDTISNIFGPSEVIE